jgi:ribosome-associated toxin RatA of RatAB toxin-antitoxin module
MSQATRTVDVEVKPDVLFDVITDFESYPKYLGQLGMESNKVISRSDNEAQVRSTVIKMGKEIRYILHYSFDKPNRITWSFVSGDLMKDNQGSWELTPIPGGGTRAKYSIEVSFGWMVPKMIVNKLAETELPDMLNAFKIRAESID